MRQRLLVLALLLFAAGANAAEVPLGGHGSALLVRATINRRVEGTFLLDTGATYCVLSTETARRAKIHGRGGGQKIQLTTVEGQIRATLGTARRVEVGTASARDVAVAVIEDEPLPGLDGILGLSFLQHFSYSVDKEKGVLCLEE